jgi:hypothetical protein
MGCLLALQDSGSASTQRPAVSVGLARGGHIHPRAVLVGGAVTVATLGIRRWFLENGKGEFLFTHEGASASLGLLGRSLCETDMEETLAPTLRLSGLDS